MSNLATRKEIGDKDGTRSCYVVEFREPNGQMNRRQWIHPAYANDIYSSTYKGAVIIKENYYREFKKVNRDWTRKDFRVALYIRAKKEKTNDSGGLMMQTELTATRKIVEKLKSYYPSDMWGK